MDSIAVEAMCRAIIISSMRHPTAIVLTILIFNHFISLGVLYIRRGTLITFTSISASLKILILHARILSRPLPDNDSRHPPYPLKFKLPLRRPLNSHTIIAIKGGKKNRPRSFEQVLARLQLKMFRQFGSRVRSIFVYDLLGNI